MAFSRSPQYAGIQGYTSGKQAEARQFLGARLGSFGMQVPFCTAYCDPLTQTQLAQDTGASRAFGQSQRFGESVATVVG